MYCSFVSNPLRWAVKYSSAHRNCIMYVLGCCWWASNQQLHFLYFIFSTILSRPCMHALILYTLWCMITQVNVDVQQATFFFIQPSYKPYRATVSKFRSVNLNSSTLDSVIRHFSYRSAHEGATGDLQVEESLNGRSQPAGQGHSRSRCTDFWLLWQLVLLLCTNRNLLSFS